MRRCWRRSTSSFDAHLAARRLAAAPRFRHRRWVKKFGLSATALFAGLAAAIAAPPARVERFTPSGPVTGPAQIAIRFTRPMVAMGDPRLPAPITGNCSAGATGRWVDSQGYAIDLPAPLPGGRRCVYDLVPGLKDAAGAPVTGPTRFDFSTGGPSVRAITPAYGPIEEEQVFLFALDAAPTPASVAAHAACLIDGVGEAVPLDILPQAARDTILNGVGGDYRVRSFLEAAGWRKPEYGDDAPKPRAAIIAARCRRALPAGGKVTLNWGASVTTANGLVAGEPWRQTLPVRPAFTARFECARVNAAAACSPLEPMRLAFAGQVPRALAGAVRLVGPDGKSIAPTLPKQRTATLDRVEFKGPFTERARYRIVLPAGIADDAGRPLANAARFPLDIAVGDFPPLAKFAGSFGILEASEGGVLPVTLRGVESPVPASATKLAARAVPIASDAGVAAWLRALEKAEERSFVE
ncbi:MAG: alpha-2-macroglobulin, partial [Sandarakinorhabdus sp.]|nr:alpha-2-macroglobulin [Sandarakinorhabdus sp.]